MQTVQLLYPDWQRPAKQAADNSGVVKVNSTAIGAGQIADIGNLICGGINVVGNAGEPGDALYAQNGFFDLPPDGATTTFTIGTYVG